MDRSSSFFLLIVFFSLIHVSCKKEPPVVPPEEKPPVYQQSIFLTVADSGLTEIYLKLSITDSLLPRGFSLYRNNAQILSGSLFGKETTLVDTTAQFNSAYSYRVFRMENLLRKDSSSMVMTKTLDTTSHELIWIEYKVGNENTSIIHDVSILNDSIIFAVGDITMIDSSGGSNESYNAIKWNGKNWTIRQIPTKDYGTLVGVFPLTAIQAFSSNDIWCSSPAELIQINGEVYTSKAFFMLDETFKGQINTIWGSDKTNIYTAGRNGIVFHYTGPDWIKINTGTIVDLTDIWGTPDGETLWACGYKYDFSSSVFLKYTKTSKQWQTLWTKGVSSQFPFTYVSSIWGNRKLYIANNAEIYELNGAILKKHSPSLQNFIYRIRGDGENNIAAVTSGGNVWHFNGASWKRIFSNSKYSLYSVAVKGKTIVAVGSDDSSFPNKAIVIIGKR